MVKKAAKNFQEIKKFKIYFQTWISFYNQFKNNPFFILTKKTLSLRGFGGRSQITLCIFTALWPPTHLWLRFCNDFTKYLPNEICNGYISLTTHPPQWHNVICEWPLDRNGANSVKISIFFLLFSRPLHLTPFAHKADEEARPPVMIAGHEGQQMAFDNDETLQQQLDFITSSSVPAHNGAFSQFFSSEDTSVLWYPTILIEIHFSLWKDKNLIKKFTKDTPHPS